MTFLSWFAWVFTKLWFAPDMFPTMIVQLNPTMRKTDSDGVLQPAVMWVGGVMEFPPTSFFKTLRFGN